MKEKNSLPGTMALTAIGLFFLLESRNIPSFQGMGSTKINSTTLPCMWAGLLLTLCGYVVIRDMVWAGKEKSNSTGKERVSLKILLLDNRESILSLVLMAVYYTLMKPLGFVPSTIAYLYTQILILQRKEERNLWIPAALAIVASLLIYFVFRYQLEVVLPQGIMPF